MSESGNSLDYMPLMKQYFQLDHYRFTLATFLAVSPFSRLYVDVSWLTPIVVETGDYIMFIAVVVIH